MLSLYFLPKSNFQLINIVKSPFSFFINISPFHLVFCLSTYTNLIAFSYFPHPLFNPSFWLFPYTQFSLFRFCPCTCRLFLMGLNKYGKGDWRSISRYYVVTKTPTQVASHAQKFFRRQTCTTPTDRRRPSIHDIQTVDSSIFPNPPQMNTNPIMTDELIPPQVPIPNPYGSLTPAMYNHHNNLHSNEGLMTNYGTEVGPGFPPGTSTFPIASSAINQPPSEIYLCSTSYPSPYPMNYP